MTMRIPSIAARTLLTAALATAGLHVVSGLPAAAAPAVYEMDPAHTFPSFEGDHFGISVWRGKFTRSTGKVILDREAGAGSVEVVIDAASIDFGLEVMNEHARAEGFLDVAKYPQVTYAGPLAAFVDGRPTRVDGTLTLHGVTRPVTLQIQRFKCMPHPVLKREVCGADAFGTFERDEFGLTAGKDYGFGMTVTLRVQVEAVLAASAAASAAGPATAAAAAAAAR